jgi:CRISPR-associated endonuclease Csn1
LAEGSEAKRCVVVSGQLTSFLRARWGLLKVRADSDRHHALDAVVVAACSHGMVKRLSDYARRRELEKVRAGFVDIETGEIIDPIVFAQLERHFPEPWPHFRHEIEARLKLDDPALLREEIARLGSYPPEALDALKPLFVSRAPQRRNSGAAHKETIYAQPPRLKAESSVTQKVPLASLTLKDLDQLIDPHRNERLYAAIRARLEAHGGRGDKAFAPGNPLRKTRPRRPAHRPDRAHGDDGDRQDVRHTGARRDCKERHDAAGGRIHQGRKVPSGAGVRASQCREGAAGPGDRGVQG